MSLRTRKRTLHRAARRAVRDGLAFYRGQRITTQFVQRQFPQLYNKFACQEPVQTHKPVHEQVRPRPGQANRASRHQIFTWNSGGLSGESYDMLISLLERQNISVAHIQETHWSFSSTWSTDSFHCIHSGATKKGTAGVLTLIRKDLCKSTQIKFQHVVPGRLLLVRFPMGQTFLNLINVYQIFVQHPDKEDSLQFQRSQLLHHLDCLIQSIPRRHLLLISGDFNGRLRPTGSLVGRAVCQSSAQEDEELHAVIECHDLCVVNTWGSGQTHSNNFAGRTSMIDFVMLRREHADNKAKQVLFLHAHPLHPPRPSFHIPMVTSFTSFWRCWASPAGRSQCQRPDVDQFLADVAVQAPRYKSYLHLLDQALQQGDPCDLDLDEVVSKIARHLNPGKTHDTPPSLQAALAAHVQTGWTLWSRLHRLRGSSLRVMFRGWSIAAKLLKHRKLHRKHHRPRSSCPAHAASL